MRNQGSLIQFQTLWCTVRQRDRCERFCVSVLLRSLLTLSALQAFMARIRALCCRVMSSQTLAILVTKGAVKSTRLSSDLMRYTRHEYFVRAKGAATSSERKSQSVFVFVTNKRSRCLVMSIRRRHCDVPGHWSRNLFVHQSSDAEFLYKSRISLMMGKLGSISWSECNMIIERLASVVHS